MANQDDSTLIASPSAPEKRKADEIDAPEVQAPTKVLEVVTDADVTFNVGTGKDALQLRVSGAAMGWASPMFKTLLSSQFIEAQTKTINLPEVDPQVFVQFCNIIHHRPVKLDQLTGAQVLDLALLGDMRGALDMLKPWLLARSTPVRKVPAKKKGFYPSMFIDVLAASPPIEETETRFSSSNLIDLSALCSWNDTFYQATKYYMAHYPTEAEEDTKERESIPSIVNKNGDSIYDVIAQEHKKYVTAFLNDIYSCINKDVDRGSNWGQRETCIAAQYGMLQILLRDHDISPMNLSEPRSLVTAIETVGKVVDILRSHRNVEMEKGCSRSKRPSYERGTRKPCDYCCRNFDDEFDEIVEKHTAALPGVCLGCFRVGKEAIFVGADHKCIEQ